MSRINTSTSTRRRQTAGSGRQRNGSGPTQEMDLADLVGSNTTGPTNDDDAGRVHRLFEEVLGDNASALGSVAPSRTGEVTAMSSVLGPPQKDGTENAVGTGVRNGNGSNPTLGEAKAQQQQRQQQQEEEGNDEDTYMTKPRMIAFDQNDDDVSALFGGHGGASVGGVESYMGTFAAQRKNRPRGGGAFGNKIKSSGRNNRRIPEGESTLGGVASILDEIGLGKKHKKSSKGSFADGDSGEDDKGHTKSGRRTHARVPNARMHRRGRDGPPPTILEHVRRIKPKTWAAFVVAVTFVTIQLTSVRRRDRKTMDHLNWRFRNHRRSSAGMSDGIRHVAMEHVEGTLDGRRRGGSFNEYNPNSLDGDGIGDVLRKTVPLVHKMEWEVDGTAVDDGMFGGDAAPNLRGGHRNKELEMNVGALANRQREMQERREQGQQQPQQIPGGMQQQHQQQWNQTQQMPQQKVQLHQMAEAQGNDNFQHAQNPPPPKLGDTHPLLEPNKGLSMADALDKLNTGSDKLSDIDPRPKQRLSNDIIPDRFSVFADLKTPYVVGRDTPYFWHIPRSGGVVVKTMLSHCLGQTLAAEVGELDGHQNDAELKVISYAEHNYTNVNIATPEGIQRALNMGLVPSHLAHTLVSAHVDLVPSLFNANDRARAFVLFRHPVDRAASMFYFLQGTGYPPLKNMTVDDYAKSELIENNWLVRILSESMTGPIDMDNLEIAKEVLRRKFIVGLIDNKRGSFARFDHYFKWKDSPHYEKEFGCRKQLMDEKYVSKHRIRRDSETWKLLHEQNRFDVHLYDFAKELFSQQSYIFGL